MSAEPPDAPWLLQWVVATAFLISSAIIGFLWRQIGQSKSEAIAAAEKVRVDLGKADDLAHAEIAARHAENQVKFDKLWEEITRRGDAATARDNRLDDKLSELLIRIADKPSRADVRADMATLKTDIAALIEKH